MSLCVAASGTIIALAANTFTLSWTHSVERTVWAEEWVIEDGRLAIVAASVEGSGAGIHIPEDAVRTPHGWTYRPSLPPLERLTLASSGATFSGWTLCTDGQCIELGATEGDPISIWSGADCR